MSRAVLRALLGALLLAAPARAAEPSDLRRLFPSEADVFVARDGLVRAPLPAEVLAACRADLADLRLFDRQEREVPFAIDAGVPAGEQQALVRSLDATVIEAERETVVREDGPPLFRETYVIAAPPDAATPWELVFDVERAQFVRKVSLAAVAGDGTLRPLGGDESIFRLDAPPAGKRRLALPPLPDGRLRITLEGEEGGYLAPGLRFETARGLATRDAARLPLEEIARHAHAGRTVIELARPRGVVPDALRLETTTALFNRVVTVWDEGPGRDARLIGRGPLFRLPGAAPVAELEVGLEPADGDRLRLEIDDGDSPPLQAVRVVAVVRQPVLIFSVAPAGEAPAATLRFGGGRARAPRYDLAGLLPSPGARLDVEHAEAVRQIADAGGARIGAGRPNPAYDRAPALAFAMRPGAALDPRAFTHLRPLTVEPSADGLSRVRLGADEVAQARPDLGDVRVIDAEARQWPYLLQADAGRGWLPLPVDPPQQRRRVSSYRLRLPASPLAIDQVVLESGERFFDRSFRLTALDPDARPLTLARGRLAARGDGPQSVAIEFPAARVTALELSVDDGDEAPLAIRAARARGLEPALFLVAPPGNYTLLVGDPTAHAPRYELERVRDVILAVDSAEAAAGALADNPDYSVRARLASGDRLEGTLQQVLLWAVLIGAVAVLAFITLRLARRDG